MRIDWKIPRVGSPWRLGFLLASLVALIYVALVETPLLPNLGLPFGFYGDVNRVKWEIERAGVQNALPRVRQEVFLEDFSFQFTLDDGALVHLFFTSSGKNWELFHQADGLFVSFRGGDMVRWKFAERGALERALGIQIRNAADVVRNLKELVVVSDEKRRTQSWDPKEPHRDTKNWVLLLVD